MAKRTYWDWNKVEKGVLHRLEQAVKRIPGVEIKVRPRWGEFPRGTNVPLAGEVDFRGDFWKCLPEKKEEIARAITRKGLDADLYSSKRYIAVYSNGECPFEQALQRLCEALEDFGAQAPKEILVVRDIEPLEFSSGDEEA